MLSLTCPSACSMLHMPPVMPPFALACVVQALEAMLGSLKGSAARIITVVGCRGEEDR